MRVQSGHKTIDGQVKAMHKGGCEAHKRTLIGQYPHSFSTTCYGQPKSDLAREKEPRKPWSGQPPGTENPTSGAIRWASAETRDARWLRPQLYDAVQRLFMLGCRVYVPFSKRHWRGITMSVGGGEQRVMVGGETEVNGTMGTEAI